jgi:hypothetical protein
VYRVDGTDRLCLLQEFPAALRVHFKRMGMQDKVGAQLLARRCQAAYSQVPRFQFQMHGRKGGYETGRSAMAVRLRSSFVVEPEFFVIILIPPSRMYWHINVRTRETTVFFNLQLVRQTEPL